MTVPAATPPTVAPKPGQGTEYVILKQLDTSGWDRVSKITSRSAEQAVRDVVESLSDGDQGGTFVAIPARSWKPVKVTPLTVTTLKLEEAK